MGEAMFLKPRAKPISYALLSVLKSRIQSEVSIGYFSNSWLKGLLTPSAPCFKICV